MQGVMLGRESVTRRPCASLEQKNGFHVRFSPPRLTMADLGLVIR